MNRINLTDTVADKLWSHYIAYRTAQELAPRWQRASSITSILAMLKHYQSLGWDLQFGKPGDLHYSIPNDQATFFLLIYGD